MSFEFDSKEECEIAKVSKDFSPTIFWKLIATNPQHSPYSDNDIIKYAVNKTHIICKDSKYAYISAWSLQYSKCQLSLVVSIIL